MQEDLEDDDDSFDPLLAAVARIPARDTERPAEWTPPSELEEYRLIRPIGRGGMGSVWLAEDRLLQRLVAIKFIAYEPDAQTRERFVIEARAAARLQHVNVVTVHRYGELDGRPYLVSEYIRGESLDQLVKPVAWERALELGIALARGLAAAHRHGIVHRDIKPANAILTVDGDAKLVDFGLARLEHAAARDSRPSTPLVRTELAAGTGGLTAPGAIAGTPRYLAPEVRRGEPANRRSDVYGIGCVLYELVTGRAPILDADDALRVPSLVDRTHARLAVVIDRCLRVDPEERFASGDELREALEQIRAPSVRGKLPEGNPYRGLVPYEAEHRALFFGRGADIRAVIERLRADAFVLVTGDSGAGKSSLCRAGVLPEIADGGLDDGVAWTIAQLIPGQRPLAALASVVATRVGIDEAALIAIMHDEPARLARELRRTIAGTPRQGFLLFVDQLEELCTIADRSEAVAFSAVLAELVATPGMRLLATVRSDFLTRVAELPKLGAETARAIYLLRPLSAESAREAIVGPAHAKGAKFESEELVHTLVAAVADDAAGARTAIELPLLAFTLAQLWDARDRATQTIRKESLDAIGGVRGALARHADGVLASLLPGQRAAARKILLRLVTPERTRTRRTAEELAVFDATALDALVRGRLVVARGDETPTYELAHERLIDGWPALSGWLSETTEAIAAHARLAAAVVDWERLGRASDGLWGKRQLRDLELVEREDLSDAEAQFARASRRAVARRRWLVWSAAIGVPLLAVGFYVGAKVVAQRDVDRRVEAKWTEGRGHLATARAASAASATLRAQAYAKFDAGVTQAAEEIWRTALERGAAAQIAYAQAGAALEAAFLIDTARDDVRAELAAVTDERLVLAEREYRDETERAELAARLAVYDRDLAARRTAPGRLQITVEPASSTVSIVDASGAPVRGPTVAPGIYTVIASAPQHTAARLPVRVVAGGTAIARLALPKAVPPGFVYVPEGPFLFGSADHELMRRFQETSPIHERRLKAFAIARTEVTYAQWIEFLEHLPPDERARRAPRIETASTVQGGGHVSLDEVDGTWELTINPAGDITYRARAGSPIEYRDRTLRKVQDWLQFPVSGITPEDGAVYAAWLAKTGRVPRARLCDEVEWEKAARGIDGRRFPHGNHVDPDDTNIDVTYGRRDGGFGPDAVGSHPRSTSPFGADDMAGNVWEMLRTANHDGFVMRGGGYYTGTNSSNLANRQPITPTFRNLHAGLRICADL